ncbi:MAG: type I glyceraldehyde-3-phosphate dehydrogenase [Candidatus Woykebacteria bacterium RBG_13_40_15]|uniref:Glyceraldehyde-3-phosphate dehydrogenase n=1 Tax=Candidatus Woykebacteria bacterium RBG_13_40_15 TaxID=1802593 RepID=A0A1G1W5J3_9BACT|nr:MAG: type I glyceraldehyde-3-phosphate dehydrogenase [Candidatus Woykebacteria bacterium RBG_13_40_15]
MVKIGINGFGRIGRSAFKIALDNHADDVEIVAINDLTDAKTLAHLLKYDTAYGIYHRKISSDQNDIIIDDKKYHVYAEKDPSLLPWKNLGVDVVLECTGRFADKEKSSAHLKAGAKRVIISAPAKDAPTFLIGVNHDKYDGSEPVINNASCTTNSIAPPVSVINEKFGIEKAFLNTIHSYTADQNLQDAPHKDLRRARAAAENIVPTSTGAAIATTEVIPDLKGKFDGIAIRVPTPVASLSDLTFLLKKETTAQEINKVLEEASKSGRLKGILAVSSDPIVSSDIVGRTESSIVDLPLTQVIGGNLAKVFAWYDNEIGYSHRLVEMAILAAKKIKN